MVATIGDHTFMQSGITRLTDAVRAGDRFVLVIFSQTGDLLPAAGELSALVHSCGIEFVREINPCDQTTFRTSMHQAADYCQSGTGGIAVIVANRPCREHEQFAPALMHEFPGCEKCIEGFVESSRTSIFELAQQVALEQRRTSPTDD